MKYTRKEKIALAGCILLAAFFIGFTSADALLNESPAFAVDDGKSFVSVSSVEEATSIAGYQVSTPTFVPRGFQDTPEITVHDTNENIPKRVMQIWSADDKDVFLMLIQDPSLDSIDGGKETVVCGVSGESRFFEATSSRLAMLALYWRIGDMAYCLTGTLKGTVDEETLQKVACSVVNN